MFETTISFLTINNKHFNDGFVVLTIKFCHFNNIVIVRVTSVVVISAMAYLLF